MQEIDIVKLTEVLYSRSTMHALINLLPKDDQEQLRRKQKSEKKSKGVFNTNQSDSESDKEMATYTSRTQLFKFPCPLVTHSSEMLECGEWLGLKPKARWEMTKKNRWICYTCL